MSRVSSRSLVWVLKGVGVMLLLMNVKNAVALLRVRLGMGESTGLGQKEQWCPLGVRLFGEVALGHEGYLMPRGVN